MWTNQKTDLLLWHSEFHTPLLTNKNFSIRLCLGPSPYSTLQKAVNSSSQAFYMPHIIWRKILYSKKAVLMKTEFHKRTYFWANGSAFCVICCSFIYQTNLYTRNKRLMTHFFYYSINYTVYCNLYRPRSWIFHLWALSKDIPSGSCFGGNRRTGHQRMRRFSMQFVEGQRATQENFYFGHT